MSFPLLTVTAGLPALGAIATAAVPAARRGAAKWLALGFSLATLVLAAIVVVRFDPGRRHRGRAPRAHGPADPLRHRRGLA
jgi:NADH-quinone oxidoreductase subunit M